ncbi:MAG TPA: hypothetical protein VGA50_04785 [Kiloniellales bacterium]
MLRESETPVAGRAQSVADVSVGVSKRTTPPGTSQLPRLAAEINGQHLRFRTSFGDSVAHAYRAGELLEQARRECRKQEVKWSDWLARECPDISERSVQRYRRVFKKITVSGGDDTAISGFAEKSLSELDKAFRRTSDGRLRRGRCERVVPAQRPGLSAADSFYSALYIDRQGRQTPIGNIPAKSWMGLLRAAARQYELARRLAILVSRQAYVPPGAATSDIVSANELADAMNQAEVKAEAAIATLPARGVS